MNYRPKPNLALRVAGAVGLSLSSLGCYEIAADFIGTAGGYSNDPIVRDATRIVGRDLERKGERARTKKDMIDSVDAEIYREKRLKEFFEEQEEPVYTEATQDAMDKVFGGEETPDYTAVIDKINKRCKKMFLILKEI